MRHQCEMPSSSANAVVRRGSVMALALLAAGCTTSPSGSDFNVVNLARGQSITCYTNPCTVMYTMPAGTGNHAVWGNAFNLGEFPAEQVANLGPWWTDQSPVEFTVRGIAAQPAYLYVRGV